MKRRFFISLLAALIAVFGSSCYSDYGSVHTKRGAVVGGLLGAGAGALIGEHNDRELEGAAIGGVLGAITGGTLGSARDEAYYRSSAPPYRSYNNRPTVYRPTVYRSYHYSSGYYPRHSYHHHHHGHYGRRSYSRGSYCR